MIFKYTLKDLNFWSRKIHIHIGLFLLIFIWLFACSGLLLNHEDWRISSFWESRKESTSVRSVTIPSITDSTMLLNSLVSQLNAAGEITDVNMSADSIHFRVSKPGEVRIFDIDQVNGQCLERVLKYNMAGKIRTLHTFNGVNKKDLAENPNWFVTRIWRFSMDVIALGLLLVTFSSWVMWLKIRQRYNWGWAFLSCGFAGAVYFLFFSGLI